MIINTGLLNQWQWYSIHFSIAKQLLGLTSGLPNIHYITLCCLRAGVRPGRPWSRCGCWSPAPSCSWPPPCISSMTSSANMRRSLMVRKCQAGDPPLIVEIASEQTHNEQNNLIVLTQSKSQFVDPPRVRICISNYKCKLFNNLQWNMSVCPKHPQSTPKALDSQAPPKRPQAKEY